MYFWYSAFRQTFHKLWTCVADSFLQQIAQNKSWAHPKATSLSRIYKVEMQQASLLYDEAKPQSEPFDSRRFAEDCRAYGAYSKFTVCSRLSRSDDVPHADRDRVGWSPWQGGFKERDTLHTILPFVWFFNILYCSHRFCLQAQKDHWCDRPFSAKNNSLPVLNF